MDNFDWIAKVITPEKIFEALQRLRMLGFSEKFLKVFADDPWNHIPVSHGCGGLTDEKQEALLQFMKDYSAFVYMVLHNETEFGSMDAYLYVSDYPEEWESDREDLEQSSDGLRYPLAYVHNFSVPEFSEFGSIGIVKVGNAYCRVY